MTSTKIVASLKSVPEKKEKLRKAFEALQSQSSVLASFALQWKDLEDHFSSMEKSIETRLKKLESMETRKSGSGPSAGATPTAVTKSVPVAAEESEDQEEVTPRPELKSICVKLDGKGLVAFINENRSDLGSIKKEINPAIRSAPDPAKLVLDAVEGFYPPKSSGGGENSKNAELHWNRRTCILLLERLHLISPEIKGPTKEKAKKLALEWKGKISAKGDVASEALAFLQLVASYGLTSEFTSDDLLDLVVLFARRKQAISICKDLGLGDKVPDLIQKLSSKGKQLDAVKFVYAFELVEKHPPVPLLKAYIKESKKAAQEVRKKGNNSLQSQNEAIAKELAALRAVTKAIEEYSLEFPQENLEKRISQLEQQTKDKKKRSVQSLAAPNSKPQMQYSNKRHRPSAAIPTNSTVPSAAVPVHPPPLLALSQPHTGLIDRAQYMSSAGPYNLAGASSLYDHSGAGLVGNPLGYPNRSPPRSYAYSSDPLMVAGLYNRPVSYVNYPSLDGGLASSYNPSTYQ